MSAEAAAAPRRRPSPRPRPDSGPALRVVATGDSETCTLNPATAQAPTSEITKPQVSDHPDSANAGAARLQVAGFTARVKAAWVRSADYWTPPSLFTDRPASLAELADYAHSAPWTHQRTGLIRGLGIAWYRLFGLPYTVISRYREWFAQRPLRWAALAGGIKLLTMTGPGAWLVDHLVYPVARLAGHVFL